MSVRLITALLLILAGSLSLPGCGGSCSGTLSSGRSVNAVSDTLTLSASFEKDTATIDLGGQRMIVEPDRVLVDGSEVAEIDPACRKVSVSRSRGQIIVVADGETVYDSKLK